MGSAAPARPALERHGRDVYRWAYRVLGHHDDAMDVVQDVMLRWMTRGPDGIEHERAWLRRVTINRAIDVYRARRPVLDASRASAAAGAGPPAPERQELRADVAEALAGLTEQQRSVLVAKVHDGLTFARIAEEHGLAVPTVKTHFIRALDAVRTRLRRRWGP